MNLIIEGIDGSGKSTLAKTLAQRLDLTIQESEGPEQYPGEINERIRRYFNFTHTVFVRHPVISQTLYDLHVRHRPSTVDQVLNEIFYATRPIIVYCDTPDGLSRHVIKDHDSAEHLKQLEDNYSPLLAAYREWAVGNATVMYRIGDPVERIIRMLHAAR